MTTPRVRWVPAALLVAVALLATVSPLSAAERAKDRILRVTSIGGWADMRSLVSALFGVLGKSGNTLPGLNRWEPVRGGAHGEQALVEGTARMVGTMLKAQSPCKAICLSSSRAFWIRGSTSSRPALPMARISL